MAVPVLMDTDNTQYNERIRQHSPYHSEFNEILDAYNAMGIGAITAEELKSLVRDPAGLVFDKLTAGQPMMIGNLTINRSKGLEIMEKPAGYAEMEALIRHYKNTKPNFEHYLNLTDIDVDGIVVLHQSVIDKETEAAKIYAKTDAEIKTYEFAQGVIALAQEKFGNAQVRLDLLLQKIVTSRPSVLWGNDWVHRINAREIQGIDPGHFSS